MDVLELNKNGKQSSLSIKSNISQTEKSAEDMEESRTLTKFQKEKTTGAMACNIFNELRLEEKLCDVVIKVEGVEFSAHKTILCGCSSYFRWEACLWWLYHKHANKNPFNILNMNWYRWRMETLVSIHAQERVPTLAQFPNTIEPSSVNTFNSD